jgi:hypothetical protein
MNVFLLFAAAAAAASDWSPQADEAEVVRLLTERHASHTCAELSERLKTPAASLARIAEHLQSPPWAPMRAANCLAKRPTEAASLVAPWWSDPAVAGLADVLLLALHTWPEEVATEAATQALAGPHRQLALRRLSQSPSATLRALAKAAQPPSAPVEAL